MGQTLSEPNTQKETASCANTTYKVGSCGMQGWRINMEDEHTHILALPDDPSAAFFGVYDGHGGMKVAHFAGMHLHKKIVNSSTYAEGDIEGAIKRGFLELDQQMLEDEDTREDMSGCTAVVALIKDDMIYCGNVGDSRAVMSVCGKAVPLSFDHKPGNELEAQRIRDAGGWVEFNRVNGNLALSRALGDFSFKKNESKSAEEQIVTANPDVHTFKITPDAEFIVLACDGIWDVMSNQDVVDFCRTGLAEGKEPEKVCEELLDKCLAPDCELSGLGCDNMTVILVCLMQEASQEEFVAKVSREALPAEEEEFTSAPFTGEKQQPLQVDTPPTPIEELFSTPSQSPVEEIPDDEKPPNEFRVVDDVPMQDEVDETPA